MPDTTKSQYDVDVSSYAAVQFIQDGVGFAAPDYAKLRFSTDGGITFKAGATDYWALYFTATQNVSVGQDHISIGAGTAAAAHNSIAWLTSLRAGRPGWSRASGTSPTNASQILGFSQFDGPITHIRIYSSGGNNFSAGKLHLTGYAG